MTFAGAPEQAWKRLSCGDGSKGATAVRLGCGLVVPEPAHAGWVGGRWLLVRRELLTPEQLEAGEEPELA
jgi:hypothetical protein